MSDNVFNVQRVAHNLEVLAELKSASPNPDVLKRYTGWGGLRNAVYTSNVYRVLKQHCSESEIASIKKTISNAYYTPSALIECVFDGLLRLSRPFQTILEPSVGHGLFFEHMPDEWRRGALYAVEMDEVSCQLFQQLYPDVSLHQGGFETCQPPIAFDLILGNPPYGQAVVADASHPDISRLRIHHFFVAKCMRLLAPGGILAMVLPRYFLDNRQDHARGIIHQEGGSLLAAYRLPDNLFADAKVTVDLVFLVKEKGEEDWLYVDKIKIDNRVSHINRYFSINPSHIIGELAMVEAYGRYELACRQPSKGDPFALLKQLLTYFPPKKLPTLDECKIKLNKRLELVDKDIQSLSLMKNRLLQAQRDLQRMERQFLQRCVDTVNVQSLS
ncbi:Eco57I restriction-modification methylase domain-containing protein [Legionella feeleii]|uniref:Modification methylase TaqI n=1 Tax=Legionella feeleii TaxID=453 RepID=A0A0W0TH51_9GAMM|nr:Eco57I restriction-modification methylase domain-containing protein [Legionella feeleii]KTC94890.1 Modification methylase TaqI [Legionella feeleii]SPX62026.1 Modification methylase TaqI [Legionella feeleii]